ncbi:MAG: PQQ-binding-like beta-propeller repeat protein [Hyphomicrobiales bacterium]|nr:PQQ-binding-like beta-propeller repeat protein [Hyphomicrobiales bacterium]MCP5374000.1 PQQ-binding-like beta-propeller repeat protein [Hyphomicrobiales bacterium]
MPPRPSQPPARPRAHPRARHGLLRALLALPVLVSVAACDTWFGASEEPPLPGERLPVLVDSRTVQADPELKGRPVALPPPTPNDSWPQQGGYANHAMHHIAVAENLSRAWDADIGAASDAHERFISTPIVAGGRVFAIDAESKVTAFDVEKGERIWDTELTPDEEDDGHISGGLAFDQGRIFATTGFAEVIALSADKGEIMWRRPVEAPMRAAPTARGGRVFAITVDNKLYALDGEKGDVLWTHAGVSEIASLLGGASPAVDSGIVVAPYSTGEIAALRVDDGRVLWTDSLSSLRRTALASSVTAIRGRPIIDRGRVYTISHGGLMIASDLRTGRRIWEKEIGSYASPWIAGEYLFALTNDAEVLCLDRNTGRVYWVTPLPRFEDEEDKKDPIVWSGPILVSDRLIVAGSQGEALAVSPYTGEILGKVEMPDSVTVAPVVASGTVFFLSDDAELTAYR